MRRRRTLLFLIAGVVLAVVIAAGAFRSRETEYEGRKLSEWLDDYWRASWPHDPTHDFRKDEEAIRQMGTKALPYLLAWIGYQTPAWRSRLAASRIMPETVRAWAKDRDRETRVFLSAKAIAILGEEAKGAAPELYRLITDPSRELDNRECAVYALAHLGPVALEPLVALLTNNERRIRVKTLLCFPVDLGANARVAVPALVLCLSDASESVAWIAAGLLGSLRLEPTVVVPALSNLLGNSSCRVRQTAALALGEFASEAATARPALLGLLRDGDIDVREAGTNALCSIDPQALDEYTAALKGAGMLAE